MHAKRILSPKNLHVPKKSRTFAATKVNKQQNLKTMFGVRSSNQPITGKFAEEFVRNLLEAQKHPREETKVMSHNIIID